MKCHTCEKELSGWGLDTFGTVQEPLCWECFITGCTERNKQLTKRKEDLKQEISDIEDQIDELHGQAHELRRELRTIQDEIAGKSTARPKSKDAPLLKIPGFSV
jgi:hypothetical protein